MAPGDRGEVGRAVLASLEDVTGAPRERIHDDAALLRDLNMTGDDFTFVFVPNVEKALGVKARRSV